MLGIGCDHAGFELKLELKNFLDESGMKYVDFGTDSTDAVDYPVYAKKVCDAILSGQCDKGLLICGTGIGISISANRFKGIRAALCSDVFSAKSARLHNDANIVALGARAVGVGHAKEILNAFLTTQFSGETRHIKRVKLIDTQEED